MANPRIHPVASALFHYLGHGPRDPEGTPLLRPLLCQSLLGVVLKVVCEDLGPSTASIIV